VKLKATLRVNWHIGLYVDGAHPDVAHVGELDMEGDELVFRPGDYENGFIDMETVFDIAAAIKALGNLDVPACIKTIEAAVATALEAVEAFEAAAALEAPE
jgi:hypothetical protein